MEQTIASTVVPPSKRTKAQRRSNSHPQKPATERSTFRASVGDFGLQSAEYGCQLEIRVGKIRRLLRVYETREAALLALRNRKTDYQPWDQMGRNAVSIQLDTAERWDRAPQTP